MTAIQTRLYTPEDLLAIPDNNSVELVNGELVEKPASALSAMVEVNVSSELRIFCRSNNSGVVLSSTNGIQCFPDQPRKIRKPDVSVYKKGRFTREHLLEGFVSIAPDLAVEIVSTNDEFAELIEKIEEYLAAGVPLIWVIDPENEIAFVHRKDGSVAKLHKNDELSGEDILPGFACRLGDLFPDESMF